MTESLIGLAALLALLLARLPAAFAMGLVGVVGFALMRGWGPAWALLGTTAFDAGRSYTLSVIPLFVFMGNVLALSGAAHGLYAAADRALGRMRGGLAMASILACGGFSAVCGSSLATAATMSKVAMPSMRRFGYADSLAAGSIAAGGTLGILIPPSVILIIYGLLTEADIGKLFVAGVLPGLLGLGLYLLAVLAVTRIAPGLAPEAAEREPLSRRDRWGVAAVVALFAFIMAGIYGGAFTPTEAAGMGAAAALTIALAMGGLTARGLWRATLESARTTAMIFAVVIGAQLFTGFISFAGLPGALSDLVWRAELSGWAVIAGILLVYLLLGCVLESLSMILLTVPVFYPLLLELDFGGGALADPEALLIWFGILVVVATEISLITPPVGMNVFVLRGVLPDVTLATIFRGVTPFWIADLLRLAILAAAPGVSLWLVGGMG